MPRLPLVLALAAAAWPATAPAQVVYTITDLGALPGMPLSAGFSINGFGQITGVSYDSPSVNFSRAFRIQPGGTLSDPGVDLGTLGGSSCSGGGINASGQITGVSTLAGNTWSHAYRTTATGRIDDPGTDLGTLGGGHSSASAINDSGQVTGGSFTIPNDYFTNHAFRTTATGTLSDPGADLGTLGGRSSSGVDINTSGQVAGNSQTTGNAAVHAFRTTGTGRVSDPGADLGTLGGTMSFGFAINDSGQVAGWSDIAGNGARHAFRSSPNGQPVSLTDLGTLGGTNSGVYNWGRFLGINSLSVVVGTSEIAVGSPEIHAFIFDTRMRDLNDLIPVASGWILRVASDINDAGQITGWGDINGQQHAFLLTPVPEPTSLALTGCALAAAWAVRRRRAGRDTAPVIPTPAS
jgi:probable HAF family extracellular repeat protein